VKKSAVNGGPTDPMELEVIPALAAAVAAEQSKITHEGALSERAGLVLARGGSAVGELAVLANPADHVIAAARHQHVPPGPRRAVADIVCRVIEGRTVQDASDHAGIIALHRLREHAGGPNVRGILLPSNAGKAFVEVVDLIRRMRAAYAGLTGLDSTVNLFETPPNVRWQGLSLEKKLAETDGALRDFCRSHDLSEDAIRVDRIEKDLLGYESRVVTMLDGSLSAPNKPILMRALERHLKKAIDQKIQLYLEPVKDRNKLRRL
jgi:hypothetical protein